MFLLKDGSQDENWMIRESVMTTKVGCTGSSKEKGRKRKGEERERDRSKDEGKERIYMSMVVWLCQLAPR